LLLSIEYAPKSACADAAGRGDERQAAGPSMADEAITLARDNGMVIPLQPAGAIGGTSGSFRELQSPIFRINP
jgi:hypothetical protein